MHDNHVGVTTITRPDQGHRYTYSSRGPRTDMSRPGLEPGPPAWEASTLEKIHLDSLYAGYSEPLLMMRLALQQQPLQTLKCFQWHQTGLRQKTTE
jgi:hypothetical protein